MDIRVAGHRSYLNAPGSYKYRERWCLMEKQPWEHRGEMQVSLPLGQNVERVNVISVGELSAQLRQTQLTQSHPIDLYYNSQEWVGSPEVDAGAERCHKTPHCYALSVYPYCVCHSPLVSLLCIFQLLNFILQLPIIYQFQCLLRGVFSCQITSFHP